MDEPLATSNSSSLFCNFTSFRFGAFFMRAYRPNVAAAFVCLLAAAGGMAACSVDVTSVLPADDAGSDSSHVPQPDAGMDAPFDTATDAADSAPDAPADSAPDASPDAGDGGSPSGCDSATALPVD